MSNNINDYLNNFISKFSILILIGVMSSVFFLYSAFITYKELDNLVKSENSINRKIDYINNVYFVKDENIESEIYAIFEKYIKQIDNNKKENLSKLLSAYTLTTELVTDENNALQHNKSKFVNIPFTNNSINLFDNTLYLLFLTFGLFLVFAPLNKIVNIDYRNSIIAILNNQTYIFSWGLLIAIISFLAILNNIILV
jgi:hypothetical protein